MLGLKECIFRGHYFAAKKILESDNKTFLVTNSKDHILNAIGFEEESIAILFFLHAYNQDIIPQEKFCEYIRVGERNDCHKFVKLVCLADSLVHDPDITDDATKEARVREEMENIGQMVDVEEDMQKDSPIYKSLEEATATVSSLASDIIDKHCNTLLHICAAGKDATLPYAYSLLGVPINFQNKDGDTALHIAARLGKMDICTSLLQVGCNPMLKNKLGLTPRDLAPIGSQLVSLLSHYEPGLIQGILKEDHRAVVHALRRWVIPLSIPHDSPAAHNPQHPTAKAIRASIDTLLFVHRLLANDTRGVKRLLRNPPSPDVKINVNTRHADTGMTPLAAAVKNHNHVLVKELLRMGAHSNIRVDNCPLGVLAIRSGCPIGLVLRLLGGPDEGWAERDTEGSTAFLAALKGGRPAEEIAQMLRATGGLAMVDRTTEGQTAREYAHSLQRTDLDQVFQSELQRLFSHRVTRDSKKVVMQLAVAFLERINFCLDINPGPVYEKFINRLPKIEAEGVELMKAAEEGNLCGVKCLDDAAYIDTNRFTALTRAIVNDRMEVAEWLLAERPELKLIGDLNNRYPLHYAYALPDEIGAKFIRVILSRNPEQVEQLPDKNGVIPCLYRNLRHDPDIVAAIEKVRNLDPYGEAKH